MALVQRQDLDRIAAFGHIQQAIHEDDLWTAALCMWRFLKTPHILSSREKKILQAEYDYRVRLFEEKVDALKGMARGHAREDFEDWLENGRTFGEIERRSRAKHRDQAGTLLDQISSYGRSVGYLWEIIHMQPSNKSPNEQDTFELESMGKSPGMENIKSATTSFQDWVLIRREEVGEGDYQGGYWTIIQPVSGNAIEG